MAHVPVYTAMRTKAPGDTLTTIVQHVGWAQAAIGDHNQRLAIMENALHEQKKLSTERYDVVSSILKKQLIRLNSENGQLAEKLQKLKSMCATQFANQEEVIWTLKKEIARCHEASASRQEEVVADLKKEIAEWRKTSEDFQGEVIEDLKKEVADWRKTGVGLNEVCRSCRIGTQHETHAQPCMDTGDQHISNLEHGKTRSGRRKIEKGHGTTRKPRPVPSTSRSLRSNGQKKLESL